MKATQSQIRDVIKKWIDECDTDDILFVYNIHFDERITYDVETELFNVPEDEAKRIGIS